MKAELHFKWGRNNKKLLDLQHVKGVKVAAFDLPAGSSCPMAFICQTTAVSKDGHRSLKHGKDAKFTCYAAKAEVVYTNVYLARQYNMKAVLSLHKSPEVLAQMIVDDIKTLKLGIVRIHSSGDLFNLNYARAWVLVAQALPDVKFFGYTKVYASYRMLQDANLENLNMAFSIGSRDDYKVTANDVTCTVITSQEHAMEFANDIICGNHKDPRDYSIDFDYIEARQSFGIRVH